MSITAEKKLTAGYKQTEIGMIPEDWDVKRLGDIADITKLAGFEYSKYFNSYKDGGDIIVIRGTNITHNKLDLSDIRTIPRATSNNLQRSKLNKDDLVFAYVGTIGPVYLVKEDNKYHLGPNTSKITAEKSNSPEYLLTYFTSRFIQNEIIEHTSTGAQPSLSMTKIRNFRVILPPTKIEQTAIASAISDVDILIEKLEKLIEKKKGIKQGAMQELLTGKRRLPGFGDKWETKILGNISEITKGRGLSKAKLSLSGKYPCILYGELFTTYTEKINKVYSNTNFEDGLLSKSGDVLIPGSTTTTGIDLAKASALLSEGVLLGGDINVIRQINKTYNPVFLAYCLTHINKFDIAQKTKGITIHHLHGSDLFDLGIYMPNEPEQTAIAKVLSEMDSEIEKLESQLFKYQNIKQGMMQTLLTGKIRLISK